MTEDLADKRALSALGSCVLPFFEGPKRCDLVLQVVNSALCVGQVLAVGHRKHKGDCF